MGCSTLKEMLEDVDMKVACPLLLQAPSIVSLSLEAQIGKHTWHQVRRIAIPWSAQTGMVNIRR